MQSSFRKILIGAVFFLITNIIAIFGYWYAGWDILEAVYMVVITIYGVGYGEVRPIETDVMKIFTIGVIVTGCTSAIYVLGGFVQLIAEGELKRVLGVRRMTLGIEKLSNHVIVCGFGRVGRILARELTESGQEFVVIDTDQERLQEAENNGLFVIIGDATEEKILDAAGVKKARVVASVLPNDAANVFITLTVRELNPDVEIIARGESPSTEKKLLRSGATKVVLPAAIGATRIARLITHPSAEELLMGSFTKTSLNEDLDQIGLQINEILIESGSPIADNPLSDFCLGKMNQFVVVAVRHSDESVNRNPEPDYQVQVGDTLIVLAHRSAVPQIREKVARREIYYRGARG
ncbi:Voltage-gated potassium channel Kch [Polystyrenella longa]|uniref:Voltage-gated potassium channel Kch n=1 Tax=Polystyrenella longa TaxID=2528007 RepID=A0A518CI33_9PLAN|nr:potassium channel protein [Polystyrenella longa]QDU78834.1 Voltage-gated potassium channel Kch [Polystyrenella longa]